MKTCSCWLAGLCCLTMTMPDAAAREPAHIDVRPYVDGVPPIQIDRLAGRTAEVSALRERLVAHVRGLLERPRFAPLHVEPGLAGAESFFDHSGETLYALSLAYSWLPPETADRVRDYLLKELQDYPPHTDQCWYALDAGVRRELYRVPMDGLGPAGRQTRPQPLGNLYSLWALGHFVGAWSSLEALWPQIDGTYRRFSGSGRRPGPSEGDRYANLCLGGLIGYARIAQRLGHPEEASDAVCRAGELATAIVADYRAGERVDLERKLGNVAELDAWMRESGGVFFFAVGPHKRKIAKYQDLTPEVGRIIADHAMPAARHYMAFVDRSLPGWYLTAEERQFHFGENFMDYPDFALSIFRAKALIHRTPRAELARYLDLPWCAGDLYYIEKLALILRQE